MRDYKELQLFEIEKVFSRNGKEVSENYSMSGVVMKSSDVLYYEIQTLLADFFDTVGVIKYQFSKPTQFPSYAHK
jgi:phenylalanyl-tRNA synthetase beta subunit